MNQYIITEDLLEKIYATCYSRECKEKYYKEVKSHPYNPQAEREKVLQLMKQLDVYISDPKSLENHQTAWNALKAKLRQEGKQEAPETAKHCFHEYICKDYTKDCGWGFDDLGNWGWQGGFECIVKNCEYDTRQERQEGKVDK